ncbi:mucosa-associated lymphoid tissue lymphoma translocation protein 1-like isoform X2 [Myxocyprinus asiaticus]|uniref:mucosa-associated lymphoid tissue lymphoma translocation protein 1-like isoform X2 n=1 Tax=Myxocyprinus asiaticus TaxID=70543 RepID=UPI0022221FDC|nr:mucosa-associated lymphoid tissue lymphoma translocation protein 1-like isoform X2 [Myxocyprinus asiaticus]
MRTVVILQQPISVCVPPNHEVTLSVQAIGTGSLRYQWFDKQQTEVEGGTEPELTVTLQRTEKYICRVSDLYYNYQFTEWVKVRILDVPGVSRAWRGVPLIAIHPVCQKVKPGETFTLRCTALGKPTPTYQWYKNGHLLPKQTTETLSIENASADSAGSYLCAVSNALEERWSEAAEIEIAPPDQPPTPTLMATDKVALLIGNLNYNHHPGLMAPTMDVHELGNLLQQLGFRVVALLDLTLQEMQAAIDKFLQLLDRGVYAIFYYAGHGYEHSGRNYLVAIDAPRPYRTENCVCVQRVMHSMQERQAQLNVILLDTCRKWYKQKGPSSEIKPLAPLGNTVYGYATSEDAEAFEVQDGGKSTGIFTKYLNKHILQLERVTHVLEQVSADLGKDPLVRGRQVVEIRHTLTEPRALTDPVRTSGHTMELRRRDASWKQANVLPGRKCLNFQDCGVQIELSFSALFSNVLVVFGTVRNTSTVAQDCTLILESEPGMQDIFSASGRPEEIDSLLVSTGETPDSTLRLCCLQRLQGSLVIKVKLHYFHTETKEHLTQSRELDIGRPLIASCKLNRMRAVDRRQERCVHTVDHMANIRWPHHQNHPRPGQPYTRKAENKLQSSAKATSVSSNEPEENDENDSSGFTM